MTSQYASQSQGDPNLDEIEQKLATILQNLGSKVIPRLDLEPFSNDLHNEPSEAGHKELWEEQVGVKLAVRLIDNAVKCLSDKLHKSKDNERELREANRNISEDKEEVLEKNLVLQNEVTAIKEEIAVVEKEKNSLTTELHSLNKKLKDLEFANVKVKRKGEPVSKKRSQDNSSAPEEKRPRQPLSPLLDNLCPPPRPSCVLAGRSSPKEQRHLSVGSPSDLSYVPETLPVFGSPNFVARDNSETQAVIESPDKGETRQQTQHSPVLRRTRDVMKSVKIINRSGDLKNQEMIDDANKEFTNRQMNVVPQIQKKFSLHHKRKASPTNEERVAKRKQDLLEDVGVQKQNSEKYVQKQDSDKGGQKQINEEVATKQKEKRDWAPEKPRVGRVAPGIQSEIDRKSYKDLAEDFPSNYGKYSKEGVGKTSEIISDYDSDFESPNLLKKTRQVKPVEVLYVEDEKEDKIEDFASPDMNYCDKTEIPKKISRSNSENMRKLAKAKKNAENRWGIEVSELTESQANKLKNQKQSKLDNYFNNKGVKDKKTTKVQQEMETALKLSRETFEKEQKLKSKKAATSIEEGTKKDNSGPTCSANEYVYVYNAPAPDSPRFAYINNPVRGKEERKKLKGFDCRECEEYYRAKVEEGYTEEEIGNLINNCSKHRAKFKAPLTPEKLWDPDIVDGDPESPRNKTQVPSQPLMSRARRRARNREKNKEEEKIKKQIN